MRSLRVLDLFCGAGGASRGYFDGFTAAGYDVEVVGVDHKPQPNYPFWFVQADVLEALRYMVCGEYDMLGDNVPFDFIHASPPCQFATAYKRRPEHVAESPNLIPVTRRHLRLQDVPYVLENVVGARSQLVNPSMLCGSSFGLDVRRHRLFESNVPMLAPPCDHSWQTPRFPPATNRSNLRSTVEVGVWRIPLETQQEAMGIDWMERHELSQAIPPAYAEHIAEWVARSWELAA